MEAGELSSTVRSFVLGWVVVRWFELVARFEPQEQPLGPRHGGWWF